MGDEDSTISDAERETHRRKVVRGPSDEDALPPEQTVDSLDIPASARRIRYAPSYRACLVMFSGQDGATRFPLGQRTVIGRDVRCEIVVDAGDVSRRHAAISRLDGTYVIEDLGSSNGSFVNGLPLSEARTLDYGDRVQVGSETTFVFTLSDPTEDQLIQLQKMDAVGQLAAGIAHNFNNLLTVIAGNIDLAAGSVEPEGEAAESLAAARQATRQGAELAMELLRLARPGNISSEAIDVIDLRELARSVSSLIGQALPSSIAVEVSDGPPVRARGRKSQLQQVLVNLCLNARDAMPRGGRLSIEVSTEAADPVFSPGKDVQREAVLRVRDTGIGMSAAAAGRVFEPFFSTKPNGTGLGLATSYRTVHDHGGRILVDSTPGKGTCFTVHLPLATSGTRPGMVTGTYDSPVSRRRNEGPEEA